MPWCRLGPCPCLAAGLRRRTGTAPRSRSPDIRPPVAEQGTRAWREQDTTKRGARSSDSPRSGAAGTLAGETEHQSHSPTSRIPRPLDTQAGASQPRPGPAVPNPRMPRDRASRTRHDRAPSAERNHLATNTQQPWSPRCPAGKSRASLPVIDRGRSSRQSGWPRGAC